jgi:PAS domain S-box-containing protein
MQDVAGRILHFSWLRAPEYGISPEGLIGQGVDALFSADLAREHAARLQDVVEGKKSTCYDISLELAGTRHVFSITMAPYYGVDGALIGVAGSARDITEVWRQRLACRQMALEIDQWKGLVATLSHELRTPLQPLIGHLQMIVEDPGYYGLSEEAKGPLATCLACARQEQAAVEKMVGFGLLAADSVELVIQSVPLRSLVDSIVSSGGYDREAEFCNDIPETASLRGDRDRLYEVIETLVSNAVKYNEPPKKVWASYTESNRNHYITVCDNGIGISADAVESIFGPFSTGGTEQPNRERRQTDPGLSIANKYVRLHGGDITVRSVVGEGSTFTIRIPKEV